MKKVILTVLVVSSLVATSCKKAKEAGSDLKDAATTVVDETKNAADKAAEATKNAADAVADGAKDAVESVKGAVGSALDGISIPEFKDPKVGEHLKNYASYAKDYIAAGGDVVKNADLAAKGKDLAAKGKEIAGSLDAEAAKKFNATLSAIQAKMAPSK